MEWVKQKFQEVRDVLENTDTVGYHSLDVVRRSFGSSSKGNEIASKDTASSHSSDRSAHSQERHHPSSFCG